MRHLLAFFVPLALLGCGSMGNKSEAPGPASQATGVVAQQDRITYTPVLADRKNIDALQERLRKLNEAGVVQNNYSLAKAQCWLDTAKTQYHENDRTGYIEESMTESQKIIQSLEANKAAKVGYETPLVARSSRLRDDLWAELSKFKSNETTLACNARTVACAEVRLVRAGHADEQTGWRAATPHVMMAEDGIRRAGQEAASCAPPPAVAAVVPRAAPAVAPASTPAPVIVQAPAAAPVVQTITRESFVLLGDTLFKFNKSGINDMLPGGIDRLNGIAQRLKAYQSLSTMRIVGHTDRYGSDDYNNDLSARRASTVRAYLESQGVRAARTEASGMGKSQPVTNCSTSASRAVQIECMQADRRVNIDITGFVK
jgi:OmpA-OmpF porin, OOP family